MRECSAIVCYSSSVQAEVEIAIVGGGVVGLACAAKLACRGHAVIVIERNAQCGSETSSRNSGVIHAGLYYPSASLKARLCVRGRELLYARASRDAIPHRKLGKLILACEAAEEGKLEALARLAEQNGVPGLRWLDSTELQRIEPTLRARRALLSPETGIIDAHGLVASYRAEALAHDAAICLQTRVEAIERCRDAYALHTIQTRNGERQLLRARAVINAAGLDATRVAASAGLAVAELGYVQYLCKGDYFKLDRRLGARLQHLIYPLPVSAGLGVHLTVDLQGEVRAGPDTTYVADADYRIDPNKRGAFAAAVSRYLPDATPADFEPDFSGLRPKLQGPTDTFRDFVIADATEHGLPRLINLLGIESPGLTASEAIAEHVLSLLPLD
jgi:L-2-hydroxyglutarate oxidase LhgO